MGKIVMIGAGSHTFSSKLVTDFLTYPELRGSTITLMDIDPERLKLITAFAKKLTKQHGFKTKIDSTTDRKAALKDADYVTVTIKVGGDEARFIDIHIPAKYGIRQGIGDTIGPGGVFYGLRHIPALLDICHDMEELCPDALLINYTNPMAMICWALNDYTRVKTVGLCHSVQGTAAELARYIGIPLKNETCFWEDSEFSYWVAGINHMAWFLELKWKGKDAYPLLREKLKDPEIYSRPDAHWAGPDIVRVEIFKAFGYFNTESSQHMSVYVPYFRKRPELFERFKLGFRDIPDPNVDTPEKRERKKHWQEQEDKMWQLIKSDEKIPLQRSTEYCPYIIHSIETGTPGRANINVKNNGLITNLPQGCCVEVPSLVDKNGIHPCYVGDLPPQCAALDRTNISVQELAAKAAIEQDKTLAFQAILLDPLTSAILSIDETQKMVDEMFRADQSLKAFK